MMFSKRTDWERTPNQMSVVLDHLQKSKQEVLDLTVSNPTHCGFSYPEDFLNILSREESLAYSPDPRGLFKAREAVAAYYAQKDIELDPNQIILTASTSEAYCLLFRLLAGPGDEIIFPRPSYPLFSFLADINDVRQTFYDLQYSEGWQIDIDSLRREINQDTRGIVVVNPNNPTGSYVSPSESGQLLQISRSNELPVICDEVFYDYSSSTQPEGPTLAGCKEGLTFIMGGLSKSLGLPQMKLGWIVVNGSKDLVAEALQRLEIMTDTLLSVNTPVQLALSHWMGRREEIYNQISARLQRNTVALLTMAQDNELELLRRDGGWYAVLRLPEFLNEEQWVLSLLKEKKVLVQPGYFYDFAFEPVIVLSLLTPDDVFQRGLNKIEKFLKITAANGMAITP